MSSTEERFSRFYKAFDSLEAIYFIPVTEDRVSIDATIRRFEFTFELAWKYLKSYFSERDLQLNYPKDVIKEAFAVGLIDNEEVWVQMLSDRNMTSHTYDEKLADEIYGRIKLYVPELKALLVKLLA